MITNVKVEVVPKLVAIMREYDKRQSFNSEEACKISEIEGSFSFQYLNDGKGFSLPHIAKILEGTI
jgi:hypothetical protein